MITKQISIFLVIKYTIKGSKYVIINWIGEVKSKSNADWITKKNDDNVKKRCILSNYTAHYR